MESAPASPSGPRAAPRLADAASDGVRRGAVVRGVGCDHCLGERDRSPGVEDAATAGAAVARHFAVVQGNGTTDEGHRSAQRDPIGDTAAVATGGVVVHLAAVEGQDAGVGWTLRAAYG